VVPGLPRQQAGNESSARTLETESAATPTIAATLIFQINLCINRFVSAPAFALLFAPINFSISGFQLFSFWSAIRDHSISAFQSFSFSAFAFSNSSVSAFVFSNFSFLLSLFQLLSFRSSLFEFQLSDIAISAFQRFSVSAFAFSNSSVSAFVFSNFSFLISPFQRFSVSAFQLLPFVTVSSTGKTLPLRARSS
jgi:hypothetical protein